MPSISPVNQPWASRASEVATSSCTPKASAMGRVTNSLVAEVMTTVSPASRWPCTSCRAAGVMAGRITSSMKRAWAAAAASGPRCTTAAVAKRT